MAMLSVEQPAEKQKEPSALENAARVLGVLGTVAGAASGTYDTFVNKPAQTDALMQTNAINKMAVDKGLNPTSLKPSMIGNE